MLVKPPEIAVPRFWLAGWTKVQDYLLHSVSTGRRHPVGTSSLGTPFHAVEYPVQGAVRLMVVGGTHGHEPGTIASAMNLLHLMETGLDLAGGPHDRLLSLLRRTHLYVVPCLNPDGRAVCPETFYAQGVDTCVVYASGLKRNGDLIPYDADTDNPLYAFDPDDALFVGGQFNGAGIAINRRRSPDVSDAVEVQALFDFVKPLGLDAIMDLHACGYNFAFQMRSHESPYWPVMRDWQRRAEALFAPKGRQLSRLHGDGDPPEPVKFHFNSTMFHRHARLAWLAYEGRQGYLGRASFMPLPTEWEIVDDYLSAITVFVELGLEDAFGRANRETFGGGKG